jgi:CheY-like chemotaxis protein
MSREINQNDSPSQKRKILVVDDEPNVRKLLRTLLRDYTVVEAEDGEKAVEIAGAEKPDLILMDIMMPKMDGYSSCYVLKREPATRSIPIIILTAIDLKLNLELGKEIGADGYITKPFNSQDLLDNIAQVLAAA